MKNLPVEFVFVDKSAPTGEMGVDLAQVIVDSNLAKTKTEARRQITEGAIRLNDQQVFDPFARLMIKDGTFIVVQKES
jgi:tyrosyl-tRNA synthetase